MRHTVHRVLFALAVLTAPFARGQTTKPTTEPSYPPQVAALLDQLRDAYAQASSLELSGTISFKFEGGGEERDEAAPFTAVFRAPNQFRHEVKDDLMVVCTGKKGYAYLPAKNQYFEFTAPAERDTKDLPDALVNVLSEQNPMLLLALSPDAGKRLVTGATDVQLASEQQKIGDASYAVLSFARDNVNQRVFIDPATHLVRRIEMDRTAALKKRGLDDVSVALVTLDATKVAPAASAGDDAFAWNPPVGSIAIKAPSGDDEPDVGGQATALVGKPAPDFRLKGLDGQMVTLSELKGSVVVLDFWATWCGPCRASMPHLDKLYQEKSADGLKLFAVDVKESKQEVEKFIRSKNYTMPVLLDTDGEVAGKYKVNGIPQTVVIGKDGAVKKVIVGFGGEDTPLRTAVDAAMKE
jgi:thiol-disulfide isomerase/thioredoxin/outer membrane lipoprotein-sorting protein